MHMLEHAHEQVVKIYRTNKSVIVAGANINLHHTEKKLLNMQCAFWILSPR